MSESRLEVLLGRVRVGVLERSHGGSRFLPDPTWAERPAGQRPVLGQRFEERPWTEVRTGQGLPPWFEHTLPEAGGPLRRAIARALKIKETQSFDIAAAVGLDLPGAVTLRPDDAPSALPVGGRRVLDDEPSPGPPLATLRFSLAGVQLKFSGRSTARGIAVGLGGDKIVKLADQRYDDVPANEFAVMRWAALAGMDVPEVELIDARQVIDLPSGLSLRDDRAFVIARYDRRDDGSRVHQEDFAQVIGLSAHEGRRDKYEGTNLDSIARLVAALAPEDVEEFLRRVAFMIVAANNDMHAKNWSLVYPDGLRPRLAPAYDLLSTEAYLGTGAMALSLSGVRRLDLVTLGTIDRFSERVGIDGAHARAVVKECVVRTLDAWPRIRPLTPDPIARFLDRWLIDLPLARACRGG